MQHPSNNGTIGETPVRILEVDNNRRGDLFGRLMADLFISLGFDQPRLNIHKSGRELDLTGDHRLEPRRAIAECKATSEATGGGDVSWRHRRTQHRGPSRSHPATQPSRHQ